MLDLILISPLAFFIGYRIGQQRHWSCWHGPLAAAIVMPLAMAIGFNVTLSVAAPVCLAAGFLIARRTV